MGNSEFNLMKTNSKSKIGATARRIYLVIALVLSQLFASEKTFAQNGCVDDTWTATSTTNAPEARYYHTAVWTGSEMIVWGGSGYFGSHLENQWTIRSRYRQLDSNQHDQRA